MSQKTIAVDFDGVIHWYSRGWLDGTIYDPPVPGVREALAGLRAAGHHIMIFSTRASARVIKGVGQKSQLPEMVEWLALHEIPYDSIWPGEKPFYEVLIDDRALRFGEADGGWGQTMAALRGLGLTGEPAGSDSQKSSPPRSLAQDLASVLNSYSCENRSNTPDFILAKYLLGCLEAFEKAVADRNGWYGYAQEPGGIRLASGGKIPAEAIGGDPRGRWQANSGSSLLTNIPIVV